MPPQFPGFSQDDPNAWQGAPGQVSTFDSARGFAQQRAGQGLGFDKDNWRLDDGGQIVENKSFIARNPWLIPLLVGGGVGAAGLVGAGAFGGAGAAGAAGGGGAAASGTAAGVPTGLATMGAAGIPAAAGTAAAGTGIGFGMNPSTLNALVQAGSALGGYMSSRNTGRLGPEQRQLLGAQTRATETENALQQLLLARKRSQNPLWEALQQMAFSRLPIFAQQGAGNFNVANPAPASLAGSRPRGDAPITGRRFSGG